MDHGTPIPNRMPQPCSDRLVVEPIEDELVGKDSKLVIPDHVKDKPTMGRVIAIGPGARNLYTGERIPIDLKIGQVVVFTKFIGLEVRVDGKKCLVLGEQDVQYVLQ